MGLKCRDGPAHGKYSWKRSHKRTISFPLAKSRKEQKHYQGFCSCFSWCRDPRLWDPTPYKHSRSSIGRGSWWDTEILTVASRMLLVTNHFCNKMPILKRLHVFSSIALLAAKVDWRSAAPCGYGGVYAPAAPGAVTYANAWGSQHPWPAPENWWRWDAWQKGFNGINHHQSMYL